MGFVELSAFACSQRSRGIFGGFGGDFVSSSRGIAKQKGKFAFYDGASNDTCIGGACFVVGIGDIFASLGIAYAY